MDIVTRSALVLLLLISSHANAEDRVLGILDIPSVFNTNPATSANSSDFASETPPPARRFNLRDKPGLDSRVVSTVAKGDVLANEEFSYEQTGALVYEYKYLKSGVEGVSDTWYKLLHKPSQSFVWINLHPEMTFHWLSWLLVDSLVYTHEYWDGFLMDSLGDGSKQLDISGLLEARANRNDKEISASVIQFDTWQEQDWMLVVLFEESPCLSTRQQPRVVAAGWMRVYDDEQRVNAWYYSRGC